MSRTFRFPSIAAACALALCAACGDTPPEDFVQADVAWDLGAAPTVRVLASKGAVLRFATGAPGLEHTPAATIETKKDGDTLRIVCTGGRANITLPENTTLTVTAGRGAIEARGAWRSLSIRTRDGDVRAHGRFTKGATLRSGSGSLNLIADQPCAGELACESASGDIAVQVPASSSGEVNLYSGAAKVGYDKHERLWSKTGPQNKSVVAWLGPKPTVGERQAQASGNAPAPPSILARTQTGKVEFRLTE